MDIGDPCRAKCSAPARYLGSGRCLYVSACGNELGEDDAEMPCGNEHDFPLPSDEDLKQWIKHPMPNPICTVTDALRKGMMSTVEECFLEWVKTAYDVLEESAAQEWEKPTPNWERPTPDFTDAVGRARRASPRCCGRAVASVAYCNIGNGWRNLAGNGSVSWFGYVAVGAGLLGVALVSMVEVVSMAKRSLGIDRHKAMGLELKAMRDRIGDLGIILANTYGKTKKACRAAFKIQKMFDSLRSTMENQMLSECPGEGDHRVYYPGSAEQPHA